MLKSYKCMDGLDGMGWKSLKALILRAPLCGAIKWGKGIMHGVHAAERWGEYKAQNACITGSPYLISLLFASC